MSRMNEDARLHTYLRRGRKQHYIEIKRGHLASLRVRMSEAIDLADSLVDLFEQQQAKAEEWKGWRR